VTANGIIIASSIFESNNSYYGLVTSYSITYEFRVGNRTIRSDKITFADTGRLNEFDFAENYVKKYPIGRTVTVYYEKNDPTFCVLEPDVKGLQGVAIILILSGVVFTGAFTRMLWLRFRQR
jgi:hypothetical protein